MGLRTNCIVKVWSLYKDNGWRILASATNSKKKKDGSYESDWHDGRVQFMGKAYEKIRNYSLGDGEHIPIILKEFEVKSYKDKDGVWRTCYNFYDFEFFNSASNEENQEGESFSNVPIGDDFNLPFA